VKRLTVSAQVCAEILGLLVAMAWADGALDQAEKDGVRGAARVLNLPKQLRDELDTMLESPPPFDQILLERFGQKDRAFAFVAAAWLARADDKVEESEEGLLDKLGGRLGLSHDRQKELVQIARDLEPRAGGDRAFSDELVKLFKAIPPRLAQAEGEPGEGFEVVIE
jgi:uncharacterized membrane protein YebE (DUF533 family)